MPTFGDCELIWTNVQRKSIKKITYEWNGLIGKEKIRLHPTQKPVGLIEEILNKYSKPGDIICDPFMGSGTTAVAAWRTQRHFIGWEKDPKYYADAMKRIEPYLKQQRLM